jgi:lipopolysaccharide transport system ATP-binding protein
MQPILEIQNVSKKFRINHEQSPYLSLRDSITRFFSSPLKNLGRDTEEFWALKDLNFNVMPGETIGIIGKNGAGKSTLLKILSKITPPTSGRIIARGRIASLLEVGTGFHSELTGRENIFMNGSILGMRRKEILKNFDAIVNFAGVEKFIDTPLKHYSSGMQLRLAFAVAAFLENEILIIDEVLAVGDAEFQKKCMGKMEDVSRNQGRTVLFVSHNMKSVQQLCNRIVWLDKGIVFADGKSDLLISDYNRSGLSESNYIDIPLLINNLCPDNDFKLVDISIKQNNVFGLKLVNGSPFEITLKYEVLRQNTGLRVFFDICDNEENILVRSFNDEHDKNIKTLTPGIYESKAIIPANIFAPVNYELKIHAGIHNIKMCLPENSICLHLQFESSNDINKAYRADVIRSKILPFIEWDNMRLEK